MSITAESIKAGEWRIIHPDDRGILFESRIVLGLTQKQVAERARIPLETYQRFENGDRKLKSAPFGMVCRILEALEMDIADYFHGEYILGEPRIYTDRGICYKNGGRPVDVDVSG